MTSPEPMFVFLPGIGADHRLFKYQTAAFPDSLAVDWIDPQNGETLEQYAVRLADTIRTKLAKRPSVPVIVCGLSLGGMIAPYIARYLNAAGCVLLCSIRSPKEFPRRYYADWLVMRHCLLLRMVRIFIIQHIAGFLLLLPGVLCRLAGSREVPVIRQMLATPVRRFAGLARMMFDWAYRRREESEIHGFSGPVLQIHGTRDPLLPIRLTTPDVRIPGGGHTLATTHSEEINAILKRFAAGLRLD